MAKDNREIAGDILLATQPDGTSFVQFSKTPFTLVTARATEQQWEIDFPPQRKHYSAPGKPPTRLIWLYLASAVAGSPLPKNFSWHHDQTGWRLTNTSNGESLEGFFASEASSLKPTKLGTSARHS
jgi:hypothetical protein